MEKNPVNSLCGCSESKTSLKLTKYYREIGAEVIGNQLLIRIEKNKFKQKKKSNELDPPCNCNLIPEIKKPIRTQPPRIINVDDNNQIIFRIDSKFQIKSENPKYQPKMMTYQLGDISHGDQERTLTINPQLTGSGPQEIYKEHLTIGNQNIFMMKIKKNSNTKETKKRNIELEVTYPNLPSRIPTPPPTPPPAPPPTPTPSTLPPTLPSLSPSIAVFEVDNTASLVELKKVNKNKKAQNKKKIQKKKKK